VITDKFWSIQKDIANAPHQYFKSNYSLIWMVYNRYCPILKVDQDNPFFRDLIQHFNTTDDGK